MKNTFLIKSLKNKIIANVILLHSLLMGLVVYDMFERQKTFMKEHIKSEVLGYTKTLALNSSTWLLTNDLVGLNNLVYSLKENKNIKNVIIFDNQRRVRASLDKEIFNLALNDEISLTLFDKLTDNYFTFHHNVADGISSIKINQEIIGYVRIIQDISEISNELDNILLKGFLYTCIAIIFGAFIAWLSINGVIKRLSNITNVAEEITKGKLSSARYEILYKDKEDEVGRLSKAIFIMLETLREKEKTIESYNQNLQKKIEEEIEEKEKEQMLKDQSKLAILGEMIGAISHQLKQPLNSQMLATQNIIELFEFEELDEKNLTQQIQLIRKQVDFMTKTIETFRDFFKNSKKETFEIKCAIEDIIWIIRPILKKENIDINLIFKDEVSISGLKNDFKQVILNIINNSKDVFIERKIDNRKIDIICYKVDYLIIIEICDNGQGIPDLLLPNILFEPFISTKGSEGTGIGLSICKSIIEEKMNGKIFAQNIDYGAKFKIELPYV